MFEKILAELKYNSKEDIDNLCIKFRPFYYKGIRCSIRCHEDRSSHKSDIPLTWNSYIHIMTNKLTDDICNMIRRLSWARECGYFVKGPYITTFGNDYAHYWDINQEYSLKWIRSDLEKVVDEIIDIFKGSLCEFDDITL